MINTDRDKLEKVLKYVDYEEAIVIGSIFGDLQQENIQLKADLQALRERMKSIEWADNMFEPDKKCHVCGGYKNRSEERLKFGHKEDCWLDAELDKLKGVE